MRRIVVWLIIAAALLLGFALYHSPSESNLNVDPHVRGVIEKAKRR
jgi:hypothetical protein